MTNPAMRQTVNQFLKTTTLHGFKYLCSKHYIDRIGWILCCCASAGCAGMLCIVLWARFLEVPALLTLHDDTRGNQYAEVRMPGVAVCPSAHSLANMFIDTLSPNKTITKRLPAAIHRLLSGRPAAKDQLLLLEQLLSDANTTLPKVIQEFTPNCSEITKRCRYLETMVPCEQLFEDEMVYWKLCCVMRPTKFFTMGFDIKTQFQRTQTLDLVLQCNSGALLYGCEFITIYEGEEWLEPTVLLAGYYHLVQLRFVLVPESQDENLVAKICESDTNYSRSSCMRKCAEKSCGCNDPAYVNTYENNENSVLPPCSVTRLECLSGYKNNASCNCLSPCKKLTTYMVMDSNQMNTIEHVIDPLYAGLNVTPLSVVSWRVNMGDSRVFLLKPTETWITLLSSLGGVFNMFLGVGLFSVLELLYFIIIQLPIAIWKSSEVDHTVPATAYN